MKPTTMGIILIAIVVIAVIYFGLPKGGVPGNVFTGQIRLKPFEVKGLDGSTLTTYMQSESDQMRLIHGNMAYNDKVTDYDGTNDYWLGTMRTEDKGYWYLIIDEYGNANNTQPWLDFERTMSDQPIITRIFGADGDQDGFNEDYIELYLGDLPPLVAGESYKSVDLKLVYDPESTIDDFSVTSVINATVTASYAYLTASGYESALDEGDMVRIAKIQISVDTTGTNETYPDLDYWQLTSLKVGPYTWSSTDFGAYDLSNARYEIRFGNQRDYADGKPLFMPKNAATMWCPFELKAYTAFGANVLTITVNLYFYETDGTMSTAEAWTTTWTSS